MTGRRDDQRRHRRQSRSEGNRTVPLRTQISPREIQMTYFLNAVQRRFGLHDGLRNVCSFSLKHSGPRVCRRCYHPLNLLLDLCQKFSFHQLQQLWREVLAVEQCGAKKTRFLVVAEFKLPELLKRLLLKGEKTLVLRLEGGLFDVFVDIGLWDLVSIGGQEHGTNLTLVKLILKFSNLQIGLPQPPMHLLQLSLHRL